MRTLLITGYVAAAVAMLVLTVAAHRRTTTIPTFGEVVSRLSARRIGRVTVMLCWWWIGWHFFVR